MDDGARLEVLDEESRERLVDSLVGEGQYQKIKAQADAMVESAVKATPPDRTVAAQVGCLEKLLLAACQSGQMSEGRYDAYCRQHQELSSTGSGRTAIDAIDEARLEAFFNHLSAKVGCRRIFARLRPHAADDGQAVHQPARRVEADPAAGQYPIAAVPLQPFVRQRRSKRSRSKEVARNACGRDD